MHMIPYVFHLRLQNDFRHAFGTNFALRRLAFQRNQFSGLSKTGGPSHSQFQAFCFLSAIFDSP